MTTNPTREDWRLTERVMRSWNEPRPTTRTDENLILIENLDHPAPVCAVPTLCGMAAVNG